MRVEKNHRQNTPLQALHQTAADEAQQAGDGSNQSLINQVDMGIGVEASDSLKKQILLGYVCVQLISVCLNSLHSYSFLCHTNGMGGLG
ncbi:MAG: hypothetical protein IJP92_03280 [Lachnospiraceae bacterium]|nr:hypothetical protein [Lachnospiraceae bacterium]